MECIQKWTDGNEPLLPQKRKAPKQYEMGNGECYFSATVEEYYRQLYFEALAYRLRFDQPDYKTLSSYL